MAERRFKKVKYTCQHGEGEYTGTITIPADCLPENMAEYAREYVVEALLEGLDDATYTFKEESDSTSSTE